MMGISKRELLEDYYPGELTAIIGEWVLLHTPADQRGEAMEDLGEVSPEEFLRM